MQRGSAPCQIQIPRAQARFVENGTLTIFLRSIRIGRGDPAHDADEQKRRKNPQGDESVYGSVGFHISSPGRCGGDVMRVLKSADAGVRAVSTAWTPRFYGAVLAHAAGHRLKVAPAFSYALEFTVWEGPQARHAEPLLDLGLGKEAWQTARRGGGTDSDGVLAAGRCKAYTPRFEVPSPAACDTLTQRETGR